MDDAVLDNAGQEDNDGDDADVYNAGDVSDGKMLKMWLKSR